MSTLFKEGGGGVLNLKPPQEARFVYLLKSNSVLPEPARHLNIQLDFSSADHARQNLLECLDHGKKMTYYFSFPTSGES